MLKFSLITNFQLSWLLIVDKREQIHFLFLPQNITNNPKMIYKNKEDSEGYREEGRLMSNLRIEEWPGQKHYGQRWRETPGKTFYL